MVHATSACDQKALFYSVESKLVLISKYIKTIDKVFRGKKLLIIISDCPIRTDFLTALSLNTFFNQNDGNDP